MNYMNKQVFGKRSVIIKNQDSKPKQDTYYQNIYHYSSPKVIKLMRLNK